MAALMSITTTNPATALHHYAGLNSLVAWQHLMLRNDLQRTSTARLVKPNTPSRKMAVLRERSADMEVLARKLAGVELKGDESAWASGDNLKLHASALEAARCFAAANDPRRDLDLTRSAKACAGTLSERIEALRLLIELHAFEPWPAKTDWDKDARSRSLADFTERSPALTAVDNRKASQAFRSNIRRLKLKTTNWWKVAGYASVGGILAAPAFFVAAPVIGATIGGYMGLSGAAATSAGLAALGGGSLAAGGLGMAGGTTILVTTGSALGGVTATTAAYFSPFVRESLVADAVKTQVLLQMLADSPDSKRRKAEEVALQRFVIAQTTQRLNKLEDTLLQLGLKLQQVRSENRALRAKNQVLQGAYEQKRDENRQLRRELEAAEARLRIASVAYQHLLTTAGGRDVEFA